MAGETVITIIGNLTDAPELRFTNNGVPVASFTVASTPRTFDRKSNEWRDGDALFLRCTVWREMAEHVAQSLTKGVRVIVSGALRQNTYEVEGQRRTSYELTVEEVGASLRYGTTAFTKAQRGGAPQGVGQPQQGFAGGSSSQQGFGGQGDAWSNPGQDFSGNEEAPF